MKGAVRPVRTRRSRINVDDLGTNRDVERCGRFVEHDCPSSDDLRHTAGFRKGGSASSVIEIMRHAVGAASDGLRLSGA
jgi:hypothetical protein